MAFLQAVDVLGDADEAVLSAEFATNMRRNKASVATQERSGLVGDGAELPDQEEGGVALGNIIDEQDDAQYAGFEPLEPELVHPARSNVQMSPRRPAESSSQLVRLMQSTPISPGGATIDNTYCCDPSSNDYPPDRFLDSETGKCGCPFPDCAGTTFEEPTRISAHLENAHFRVEYRCITCLNIFTSANALVAYMESNGRCHGKDSPHYNEESRHKSPAKLRVLTCSLAASKGHRRLHYILARKGAGRLSRGDGSANG